MTKEELERALAVETHTMWSTAEESWTIVVGGLEMRAYSNVAKDRMRVMAPVAFVDDLQEKQLHALLQANFHADARYGVHEDKIFAVFLHPLASLRSTDLRSGLRQVVALVRSYGTSFSSGPLRFQWPRPEPQSAGGIRRMTEEAVQENVARTQRHSQPGLAEPPADDDEIPDTPPAPPPGSAEAEHAAGIGDEPTDPGELISSDQDAADRAGDTSSAPGADIADDPTELDIVDEPTMPSASTDGPRSAPKCDIADDPTDPGDPLA